MSKQKNKNVNWEPDIERGLEIARKIRESNERLKEDADTRQREGFVPGQFGGGGGGGSISPPPSGI